MAERVQVELIDDLDGGPANQTVKFGFDGAHYVIDLSDQHAKALRAALATFVEHARVTNDRPEPVAPARELPAERPSKAVRAEKLSHTAEIRELLEKAKSKRPPSVEEAPPVEKDEPDPALQSLVMSATPARVQPRETEVDEDGAKPSRPAIPMPNFSSTQR